MAETSDGFISTKETRKLIGVTTATLINWSKEGKIGFIIGPSGVRLYNKKDTLKFGAKRQMSLRSLI